SFLGSPALWAVACHSAPTDPRFRARPRVRPHRPHGRRTLVGAHLLAPSHALGLSCHCVPKLLRYDRSVTLCHWARSNFAPTTTPQASLSWVKLCGVGGAISENGKTSMSRNEPQQARTSFICMRTSNCCPQAIYSSQFLDFLMF